ncbi:3,4-dihydroxy 2-butanone 4-phosphate synthase [Rhizina undulata]
MTAVREDTGPRFDSIEETVEAFRRGEFIVVLDSANRENEGDLIIAAEDLTAEKMAFMVRWTSGLICAPLSSALIDKYNLPQMVPDNQEPHSTAFTVSIDARHPTISTGISSYDRALTARTLASPGATAADFRSPGHLFPLRAVEGGVIERRGHTEAAVEFCKLAGKTEAAAICELVKESDGLMMRRDDCLEFGRKWGFKVSTIEDLVEYLKARQ